MKRADNRKITEFVEELQEYVREGVSIWMDGESCSPLHAARKCLLKEESCYMRDYVTDEKDRIVEIRFDRVSLYPNKEN